MKKDVSKTNDFVGGSGIGSSRDGGPSFSFFRISTSFFAKYCFNSFFKFKQSLRGVDIFTTNFFCTSLIEVKFNANLIYVKESGALNQIGYVFFVIPSNECETIEWVPLFSMMASPFSKRLMRSDALQLA